MHNKVTVVFCKNKDLEHWHHVMEVSQGIRLSSDEAERCKWLNLSVRARVMSHSCALWPGYTLSEDGGGL